MGTCGATCGITKEREREKDAALAAIARAFPGLAWRAPREVPGLAVSFDEIRELGSSLEGLLPVRAIPRLGASDGCDWLYLLAGVHRPSLVEIFDDPTRGRPTRTRETYVRIGFSPLGRFVTLQEVTLEAHEESGAWVVVEEPVLGIEDRRLQAIVKGLQGSLRKARLVVLDMAFLVEEVHAAQQAEFARTYGGAPTRWSFLFEGAPPLTSRAASIALAR